MRAAAEGGEASVRTLCMAAQFYHMARMPRKSRQMALRAVRQHPDGVELRMLIHTLGELGMDAEAGECARLAMQETPYDRQLSARARRSPAAHGRAARAGGEVLGAHRPHRPGGQPSPPSICRPRRRDSAAEAPEYAYQVPRQEAIARLGYVADVLSQRRTDLETPWREDAKFRACSSGA